MARGYLKEVEYREKDITNYIRNLMRSRGRHQKDIANLLGLTEGRIAQKFKTNGFTATEILQIFRYLKADAEAVGKLFTFETFE